MSKVNDANNLSNLRHSLAHLLAAAVVDLWPDTRRAIGPAIDDGFYFDFEFSEPISEKDLPKIEKKMRQILPTWDEFSRIELSATEAKNEHKNNPYKLELIEQFSDGGRKKVTVYQSGKYRDLCRGGHVASAKEIDPQSFKLHRVAGAYWRGSEKNPMLTRIYGLAFETKKDLEDYLALLAEAEKRDHKKLGPKLELFMFHPTAPGMPYWLPKGVTVYNTLIKFWREEHRARGYQEIVSPLLNKKNLFVTSGHFEHFWQDMFTLKVEGEEYGLKAMNCPNAMIVFGSKSRSYRDLPLRFSDTDTLHRNELSGTLNGLFRVRSFRQDDAHIFVTEEQIGQEYERIFEIVDKFYSIFGLEYSFRLGTRPEKFLGDEKTWDLAETTLQKILKAGKHKFVIGEKEGAFYGPKVDILMKDALNREWQMGTIQLDFQQPKRFKLEYIDQKGKKQTAVVIHRVIYGSLERFIAILIEHFAGALPLWLSPVQVAVLPISDKFNDYAKEVVSELRNTNYELRIELDERNESIGKKIREAELQKIPYILVVGEKEQSSRTISVRQHGESKQTQLPLPELVKELLEKIQKKN
ncbi:MAG: threonine--tRNA ligase [Candidatus Doudnabacteria bacterium]|nr:threonine--tRNA ligase [Candidatus Doudnabacteria bacterium]